MHATTWLNLDNIMLSEKVSHSGTNITQFHPCEVPRVLKFSDTGSRLVDSGAWGNGEFLFNKYRVQLGKMKKFWRWMHLMALN